MKKILLTIITFSLALSTNLLQEGIYPKCSYVEVTADGFRMHKNWEGRILSMKAPGTHNTELGKYSFDKFGNLIPYRDCQTLEETSANDRSKKSKKGAEISLDFDFKLDPSFSVNGGGTMPIGDNLNYEFGYYYGLDVKPNFSGFLKNISFSFMGMNLAHEDASKSSLTSTGLFTNYTLNWKKISLTGGVGMINQEGVLANGNDASGSDMGLKGELAFNISEKISICAQGIQTTTFLGVGQTATYVNFGMKYNF